MKTSIYLLGCVWFTAWGGPISWAGESGGAAVPAFDRAAGDAPVPYHGVLVLDGETGCVRIPGSASLRSITDAFTLEAKFKAASFHGEQGSVNSILRKNVVANSENFFLRFRNINGRPWVEVSAGARLGVLRAAAEVTPNSWHHLAATFDGRNLTAYLDGVVIGERPAPGVLSVDGSDLFLGRGDPEFSSGEFFHGSLDEVRIWNVARRPDQLRAHMNRVLTGSETGLVAYWNFDDGTARDCSSRGNDGQLEGQARVVEADRATIAARDPIDTLQRNTTREHQTTAERLEVLESLWRNLSEIYPALEYKGVYGREWIAPAEGKIRVAKSDAEFRDCLLELMARLQDTHTRILEYPNQPRRVAPPVFLNVVDGHVAVIRAGAETGLLPGDIIHAVDGRSADECLAEEVKRVCQSTERGRLREACGRLLLGGPGTTVAVRAVGAEEKGRELTLSRDPDSRFWSEPAISHRRLDDKIGYIRISRWHGENLAEDFDRALAEFRTTTGLVIDVRGNGGGNDRLADLVNGRLTDKPVVSSIDFWRERGTDRYQRTVGWVRPRGPWKYPGRIAVLIDEASMSACEHFVAGVEAMGNVLLVGTPTNGAGGGPTAVDLPDGTRVAVSRALGIRANGVVFEGHGIPPHLFYTPSIEDLRSGGDVALQLAREWLLSNRNVPDRSQSLSLVTGELGGGSEPVYDTVEQIRAMPPCRAVVVKRGPCYVHLRTLHGNGFFIGSPGNTEEVWRFLKDLVGGQVYSFPERFHEFLNRETGD